MDNKQTKSTRTKRGQGNGTTATSVALHGTRNHRRTPASVQGYNNALAAIQAIDERLKEVRNIFSTPWKTNGDTKSPTANNLNIRSITNVGLLIALFSELMRKGADYDVAAQLLNLQTYPAFIHNNYGLDAWKFDIELRIMQIQQNETEKELLALKAELQEFVTKEDKMQSIGSRLESFGLGGLHLPKKS